MTNKDEALKPCPFCQGNAFYNFTDAGADRKYYRVHCSKCDAGIGHPYISKDAARESWNARALTEAPKVVPPLPPQCEICDRYVKQTSVKAVGPGPQCCKDCWRAWYDGAQPNKESIKNYVLDKYGETGGEGIRLKEYIDYLTTHYDLVKKEG